METQCWCLFPASLLPLTEGCFSAALNPQHCQESLQLGTLLWFFTRGSCQRLGTVPHTTATDSEPRGCGQGINMSYGSTVVLILQNLFGCTPMPGAMLRL